MIRMVLAPNLPVARAGKHERTALHRPTGRHVVMGGDWNTPPHPYDSSNTEMWSFTLADILASRAWRLEHPYCGPAGQIQPATPDYNGWLYRPPSDSFFAICGLSNPAILTRCPGGATPRLSHMMEWPWATKVWRESGRQRMDAIGFNGQSSYFAAYHAGRDAAVCFQQDSLLLYTFGGNRWSATWCGLPGTRRCYAQYICLDGDNAYVLDPYSAQLWKVPLSGAPWQQVGTAPWGSITDYDEAVPVVFSPRSRELIFAWNSHCHTFNVDAKKWAVRGVMQGNTLSYDPDGDTAICYGTYLVGQPSIYLYTPDTTPAVTLPTFGAITALVA